MIIKKLCTCCMTEISVERFALTALDIQPKCPAGSQSKITFTSSDNEKEMNDLNKENDKVQTTNDALLIKDNTVKAEISWAVEALMST